jgi:hypothetical protein
MSLRKRFVCGAAVAAGCAVGVANADAARPVAGASYFGSEKGCAGQCPEVLLSVAQTRRNISYRSRWAAACKSKSRVAGLGPSTNLWESGTGGHGRLRGASFSLSGRYADRAPRKYGGPARRAHVTFSLIGRFTSSQQALATIRVTVVGYGASGVQDDRCTAVEHFVLKRR